MSRALLLMPGLVSPYCALTIRLVRFLYPLQASCMHKRGMIISIELDIVHVRNMAHDLVNTPERALW